MSNERPVRRTRSSADQARKSAPSLFDDALSDRVQKKKKFRFLWPALFMILGLGMAYSIFYGASEQKEELIAELEEKAQQEASELEKRLTELRARTSGDIEKTGTGSDTGGGKDSKPVKKTAARVKTTSPTRSDPILPAASPPPPPPKVQPETPRQTPEPTKPASPEKVPARPVVSRAKPEIPITESATPKHPLPELKRSAGNLEDPADTASAPDLEVKQEPAIPPEHELAYNILLENSEVAARLANREFATLIYEGNWRVVQQNKREIWIDLIAHWTKGGDSVHFIWAVNPDTGKVRALSQAARNLEAQSRRN